MAHELYTLLILALIFSYAPVVIPSSFSYPAVFNFGDSNSDTGGLVAGVAFPVGPPNGQTYFQEPAGRFCDGRLIIDFLSNVSQLLIIIFHNFDQLICFWLCSGSDGPSISESISGFCS